MPETRYDLDLIEPAPDAFKRGTWEAGELIEWEPGEAARVGIFFMDTETGSIEGYRVEGSRPFYYTSQDWRWIYAMQTSGSYRFLLDRRSGRSWEWSNRAREDGAYVGLDFVAGSQNYLLLARSHHNPEGYHIVVDDNLHEIARFPIRRGEYGIGGAFFSPDEKKIALAPKSHTVYLLDIENSRIDILYEARDDEKEEKTVYDVYAWTTEDSKDIHVTVHYYSEKEDGYLREDHRFSWEGHEITAKLHRSDLPDGLYTAWNEGGLSITDAGFFGAWPSVVVVADAVTGVPVFRVRSAALDYGDRLGGSRWLPSGDGLVMEVRDGYVIARVRPVRELIYLPAAPPGWYGWSGPAPLPAPVGNDRFFSYGRLGLYDALENRWLIALVDGEPDHYHPWGMTDREMRFVLGHGGHGGGYRLYAGHPRIETPPFSDENVLRVTRTGSCLYLRVEPGKEGGALDCLPDGTRLVPQLSEEWESQWYEYARRTLEPSIALSDGFWVYVRTDDGAEGWVSHEYLDWY